MESISGKVIVSTDWHFGIKNNSQQRLNICIDMIKRHIDYIVKNNVQALIFCGDLFHQRETVNVNTINIALKCVQSISKYCKVYLICGNHDCFLKNSTDINSLNIFKDTPNVKIISQVTEIVINGKDCLFVPWLGDVSAYGKSKYDMVFGHFEISSKYLIQSYIKEHSKKIQASAGLCDNIDASIAQDAQSDDDSLAGNFIDVAKRGGIIWAGHIHKPKMFTTRGRRFIFIGSPYQQTLGDVGDRNGFYEINERGEFSFVELSDLPRHVIVKMSDAIAPEYDFSGIKDNIVQKIYDIDIDPKTDALVSQRISDFMPYEELLPDYTVQLKQNSGESCDSLETIKKSKLEYIRNYIDNINDSVLSEHELDKSVLYSIMAEYYNRIDI